MLDYTTSQHIGWLILGAAAIFMVLGLTYEIVRAIREYRRRHR
jgi:hypothetical protein